MIPWYPVVNIFSCIHAAYGFHITDALLLLVKVTQSTYNTSKQIIIIVILTTHLEVLSTLYNNVIRVTV